MAYKFLTPAKMLAFGLFAAGLSMLVTLPPVVNTVAGVVVFAAAIWVLFTAKGQF